MSFVERLSDCFIMFNLVIESFIGILNCGYGFGRVDGWLYGL